MQRTAEKHFALSQPLGTSGFNSEYSPSWTVKFLNGTLSGSVDYVNLTEKSGGTNIQLTPQLTTELEIDLLDVSGDAVEDLEELEDGFAESNFVLASDDEDNLFVLLKISENNGLFQKKNFDIEIHEVQEENQDGTIIETLRPLSFSTPPEVTSDVSFVNDETPDTDTTYADYYFDILVDDEIDNEILCKFDPVNENMGVFSDPRTELCQDIINEQKKKVFDIYKDESDDPGEIC